MVGSHAGICGQPPTKALDTKARVDIPVGNTLALLSHVIAGRVKHCLRESPGTDSDSWHQVSAHPMCLFPLLILFGFFKDFIYFFLDRGEGREKSMCKTNIYQLPLIRPLLGTQPTTQARALTGVAQFVE